MEPFPEPDNIPVEEFDPGFVRPNPDLSTEEAQQPPSFIDRLSGKSKVNGATVKPQKVKKPAPPYRAGMFVTPLTELYTGIGMMMLPFDPVCGQMFIQQAEPCARALDELAKENQTVRKILLAVITTSTMGKVIVAHAPILAMVMMHHASGKAQSVAEQAEAFLRTRAPANADGDDNASG